MKLIDINLRPSVHELKQFGLIAFTIFALVGGLILWRGNLLGITLGESSVPVVVMGFWAIGGLSGLFSLTYPKANRPLFVVLTLVAYPIGWVLSHVIMALLFYGVITPVGLIFRVIGRDRLNRKFEKEKETYWVPYDKVKDKADYFRQF